MADSELLECGEVEPRGLGVVEILFVFLAVVFCSLLLVGVPLLVFMWKRENVSRKRRKKRRDYDALLDRSMDQLTVGDGHKFERAPFNVGTQNSTVVFVMTDIENSTDHMGKGALALALARARPACRPLHRRLRLPPLSHLTRLGLTD